MVVRLLYSTSLTGLENSINTVISSNRATNITALSISVYNGLYYAAIAFTTN